MNVVLLIQIQCSTGAVAVSLNKELRNNSNMGMRDFPNMYAQSPRAEGIHIRQITSSHVTSNMYHFQYS